MTPRTGIVGIDIKLEQDTILRKITEEGYSRFPVYEADLDHITGVIHTRDVINMLVHSKLIILDDLIRPVMFVPDSKLISSLMQEFQSKQQHLAIVLDEFGGTAGLITMEDILEEIVGEIRDEHDVEVDPFILLEDNLCRVEATLPLEDFQKKFQVRLLEENSADTVAGYVVNFTGRLPQQGEKVTIGNLEFHVTQVKGPRMERLRVRKLPGEPERD
jgi:CBS domain containing-hemolysin-like protein